VRVACFLVQAFSFCLYWGVVQACVPSVCTHCARLSARVDFLFRGHHMSQVASWCSARFSAKPRGVAEAEEQEKGGRGEEGR